jgi:outer membrane protein assembly factor BamB
VVDFDCSVFKGAPISIKRRFEMKKTMICLALCLSLLLIAGCTSAPAIPTATITDTPLPPTPTITPIPPTATITETLMPPTPTEVQATATAATSGPAPEWTFAAGGPIMSPITVADGVVYFGSEDHYLYAVDIATHDLKWKFKTDGAIRSQPAVSKDMVYAASDDSYLYAVGKSDGSIVWKVQVEQTAMTRNSAINAANNLDFFTSSPVLQDTSLYIGGTDGNLYALDAATGKTLWKFADPGYNSMIRTTPVVGDGVVYFGDTAGVYYALNAKDGTQVWNYDTSEDNYSNGMTLVDKVLYFETAPSLFALDATTGKEKWRTEFPPDTINGLIPAYDNGILYPGIGAYEVKDGSHVWDLSNPISGYCMSSNAIGQNMVYFGCYLEGLYAVDKKDGTVKWEFVVSGDLGNGVNSSPTVADGMVYFGGMDGKLYAVKDQ